MPPHVAADRTLTEALALVGGAVDVHFGADHGPEWHEHLGEFHVTKLLRQMINEQVAAFGSCAQQENSDKYVT